MKGYLAKYWLSDGIVEVEQDPLSSTRWRGRGEGKVYYLLPSKDLFRTRQHAVEWAEKARVKKIASLKKQLKKLEGMRVE